MTKIGSDNAIAFTGAASARESGGSKQAELKFRSSLARESGPAGKTPEGPSLGRRQTSDDARGGEGTGRASGSVQDAPPSYDLTQTVDFGTVALLVAAESGQSAMTVAGLGQGLAPNRLPSIAIIAGGDANGVVALGRTIFIPASTYAAWQANGKADAEGAKAFIEAYSSILARTQPRAS